MRNWRKNLTIILIAFSLLLIAFTTGQAENPIVRAVLFYSPTCPHCHQVINEDLPPITEKYGEQLIILGIDTTHPIGAKIYEAYLEQYQVPENKYGVPALVIGDRFLVGSVEIPQELPGIVDTGLANGGIDWPGLAGLDEVIAQTFGEGSTLTRLELENITLKERFGQDPLGNSISVIVLVGMIFSVGAVLSTFSKPIKESNLTWLVPVLSLIGLAVAGYLSFVEVSGAEAVCGPVGDCNAVQQSQYAKLFGIPIGIIGVAGYLGILVAWVSHARAMKQPKYMLR